MDFKMSSAICFNLGRSKILSSGNGLKGFFIRVVEASVLKANFVDARFLTHYQMTNFRLFQTEEFADDIFKFDEDGRKFSK